FDNSVLESKYRSGSRTFFQSSLAIAKRFASLPELRYADIVILQGEAIPYAPSLIEILLHLLHIPYIVDFDDAIFHYYDTSPNWLIQGLFKNKIPFVVKNSACVVAGNKYLANFARK